MKKVFSYLFLMLTLIPLSSLVSCSDDDDLPDVDFRLDISGGTSVEDIIYVVRGDTLIVNSLDVVNNEPGKNAIIAAATYYWDAFRLGTTTLPPYGFSFPIGERIPLGKHEIAVECPVYAEDKSPAIAKVFYVVKVVTTADEIPDGESADITNPIIRGRVFLY